MIVKEITSQQTHDLRHLVLREGKPRETCVFEGDDLPFAKHFGAFDNDKIVGVASIYPIISNAFPQENQLQLRGMAVHPESRGSRVGMKLVQHAEDYAQKKHFSVLWLNSRVAAVPFYRKMGFDISGEQFNIGDIGPHYLMFKKLPDIT